MTSVTVNTYTHSVTYVSENVLKSLKDIIVLSGLDPASFTTDWNSYALALRTWMDSEHLECVTLELYNPKTDALVGRWDLDVSYGRSADDGKFWVDTDQLRYAIKKAGLMPAETKYRVIMHTRPGRPDVAGWSPCELRSTSGMVRQSLGSTVEHCGLGASAAYWRKAS
jgi:hypothetical protein